MRLGPPRRSLGSHIASPGQADKSGSMLKKMVRGWSARQGADGPMRAEWGLKSTCPGLFQKLDKLVSNLVLGCNLGVGPPQWARRHHCPMPDSLAALPQLSQRAHCAPEKGG